MQKLIDAATDPRFLGIMEEFACLQGTTLWKDETQARIVVGTHLRNFLYGQRRALADVRYGP